MLRCGFARTKLTVGFDLTVVAFDYFAEMWPLGEVFQIEADVVRLGEVIKIAWVEFQEVHGRHRPY